MEFALVPAVECFFFGRRIEQDAGFNRPTTRSRYLVTQLDAVADKIIHHEVSVEAARRTSPLRKLLRDVPDNYFRRASLRRFLRQIPECFDIKDGADYRHEKLIEPDGFVGADRLQE